MSDVALFLTARDRLLLVFHARQLKSAIGGSNVVWCVHDVDFDGVCGGSSARGDECLLVMVSALIVFTLG